MEKIVQKTAEKYIKERGRKKRWQKVVTAMAAVVVFCTTYALIMPAVTQQGQAFCGVEEHKEHTADCYETKQVLTCTLSEEGHEHSSECFIEQPVLSCDIPETDGHSHDASCFAEDGSLVCGEIESESHHHSDSCYTTEEICVCGLEEQPPHRHSETCYTTEAVCICGLEEQLPHEHSETCYTTEETLICELPIHEHILQCFSNPEADLETASVWERDFKGIELSGNWSKDVITIASTQIGYAESSQNYQVQDDGVTMKGYSRYGDWYGIPYGDWCAMFCSFCLNYANVDRAMLPWNSGCESWVETLSAPQYALYHDADTYTPHPGDLIFFDWDTYDPEHPENRRADHVGFVAELIFDEATNELTKIRTIEGNWNNVVCTNYYSIDDERILGYGELPKNPKENFRTIESAPAADGAVAVISGNLPEGAEAVIEAVNLTQDELEGYFGAEKAAQMTGFVAYDIKIIVDGEEWKPDETVSVVVKQNELVAEDNENFAVAHIDSKTEQITELKGSLAEDGEISFDTDGFSLYIFYTFTVDFHFGDLCFSLNGMDSVLLSELFDELNISKSVADVQSVSFSNDSLLRVEKTENADWLLTSLAPFDTEEALTVQFASGEELVVFVTDLVTAPVTGVSGSSATDLSPYLHTSGANDWQIVAEHYAGNSVSNKKAVDGDGDGKNDVYIQKNVVPTDNENEFLVYLSIDKRLSIKEIFDRATVGLTNANKYKDEGAFPSGTYVQETPAGKPTYLLPEGQTGGYTNSYWIHFYIYANQSDAPTFDQNGVQTKPATGPVLYEYWSQRYGTTPEASNGTGFIQFAGHPGFLVVARQITLKGAGAGGHGNPLTYHIGLSSIADLSQLYEVDLQNVVDEMGDHIIFDELVAGDYVDDMDDERRSYFDEDTNTLHWIPVETGGTEELQYSPLDGWARNAAQLVYRVHLNTLDTEEEKFQSCADNMNSGISDPESYKVNNSATLNFRKVMIEGASGADLTPPLSDAISGLQGQFQIPYVRGLHYDIWFNKVSESGFPLEGAVFKLLDEHMQPLQDNDGNDLTFTSDSNGFVGLYDLPGGKYNGIYYIKEEEPPQFYELPDNPVWQIPLDYTSNRTAFESDTLKDHPENMRVKQFDGSNNQWQIVNERVAGQPLRFLKLDSLTENPVAGVKFSLYASDENGAIKDEPIVGYTDLTSGLDGVFSPESFSMPNGIFYLRETATRNGYKELTGPIRIDITDSGVEVSDEANCAECTLEDGVYTVSVYNDRIDPNKPIQPPDPGYADVDTVDPILKKQIDYLGDNGITGMADLYRLYLNLDMPEDPVDILLVIDQSGSMAYDMQGNAPTINGDPNPNYSGTSRQEALLSFLNGTQADHSDGFINAFQNENSDNNLAVLTFASDCSYTDSRYVLRWEDRDNYIELDAPYGATNYTAALDIASQVLAENDSPNRKIMIFLSDGSPTLAYSDGHMQHSFANGNVVGTGTDYCSSTFLGLTNGYLGSASRENTPNMSSYGRQSWYSGIFERASGTTDDNGTALVGTNRFVTFNSPGLGGITAATDVDFPLFYDFKTSIINVPGVDYMMGDFDNNGATFMNWYNANWSRWNVDQKSAWVAENAPYYGDAYDLYYLVESSFLDFRQANPDVAVYTLSYSASDFGQLTSGRYANEVLKYMAGDDGSNPSGRYYNCYSAEALAEAITCITGISDVSITDPLSKYVDLADAPELEITMTLGNGDNAETMLLYGYDESLQSYDFTDDGRLYLDTAATGFDADGTLSVVFRPEYRFYKRFCCEASFNIRVNEYAAEQYHLFGYNAIGDIGTDYPGNDTSSGKDGFYSNGEAKAEWSHGGNHEKAYDDPVVQVLDRFTLALRKIDASDHWAKLSGAEFDLYLACSSTDNGAVEIPGVSEQYGVKINTAALVSSKDEDITIADLCSGRYFLVETKAPDGYLLLQSPVAFTLSSDGITTEDAMAEADENDAFILCVKNSAGYVLPETGGIGTHIYTLCGIAMMAATLMYGLSLRRKRERRYTD